MRVLKKQETGRGKELAMVVVEGVGDIGNLELDKGWKCTLAYLHEEAAEVNGHGDKRETDAYTGAGRVG